MRYRPAARRRGPAIPCFMSCATSPPASASPSSMKKPNCGTLQGSERPIAFDLGAVHQPAALRIALGAAMQRAAIVPHDEVADAPLLVPGQLRARRMPPQLVEQLLALFDRHPLDIGVAAAAEKEGPAAGHRMGSDNRVAGPRRLAGIGDLRHATAQFAGTVAARIVAAAAGLELPPARFSAARTIRGHAV